MARRSRATGAPRGRPRQTDEDRLDSLVSFRINAEMFNRIVDMAKHRGMSPSMFARVVVEKAVAEALGTTNQQARRIRVRR